MMSDINEYDMASLRIMVSYLTRLLNALDEVDRADYPESLKENSVADIIHCRQALRDMLGIVSQSSIKHILDDATDTTAA